MDRALLKRSLDDWMEWYQYSVANLLPRDNQLILPKKNALALIGVRRSGKSSISVNLSKKLKNHTLYYNFEDPLFYTQSSPTDLDDLVSVFTEYWGSPKLLIFDEIQNVVGWEKWIRKAVDLNRFQIILTGSSAKLLSSEISTSIAGRCLEERVWPLSFSEYLRFLNLKPSGINENLRYLRQYLHWGGFPEVALMETEREKKQLLRQYLNDIVLKDVIDRHEIRLKRSLDQIITHYFVNVSKMHSYTSIKKAYGINVETAQEYSQHLSDAFLFFEVSRFHLNLKAQARDPKKIYCVDTGLRNTHSHSDPTEIGKLAENMVYIHLKRLGLEVSYFKEKGEVDFLITSSGKPISAIQVCYSNMDDQETREREVQSLEECLTETELKQGIILTLSREETITLAGGKKIECLPLFKWLQKS